MRTQGTFQDVYEAAKSYFNGTADDGCPHNPVVRRANGVWMLESGLHGEPEADFETSLEYFDMWFQYAYGDASYLPDQDDELRFVDA